MEEFLIRFIREYYLFELAFRHKSVCRQSYFWNMVHNYAAILTNWQQVPINIVLLVMEWDIVIITPPRHTKLHGVND